MRRSSILEFEQLIQLSQAGSDEISLCRLLGLSVSARAEPYSVETLRERFRGTWWQVVWPNRQAWGVVDKDVRCKYVADSLCDALRRYPHPESPHVDTAEMFCDDNFPDDLEETITDQALTVC
ncbi:MAG: hypothetical protein JSW27_14200 [Phycisphaerales bacterium]|nr:MAG: hypothetical protein JSW27_14200 [Phycisphaerales bacterium]